MYKNISTSQILDLFQDLILDSNPRSNPVSNLYSVIQSESKL